MHDGSFETFKTTNRQRVDVRIGVERRRRWSREEKLRIVRESLEPGAIVTEVARRNEVSASLIYAWRRQALAGLVEGFRLVEVVADTPEPLSSEADPDAPPPMIAAGPPATAVAITNVPAVPEAVPGAASPRPSIEVTLPGGAVVRVDGAADVKALRAVLGVLVER